MLPHKGQMTEIGAFQRILESKNGRQRRFLKDQNRGFENVTPPAVFGFFLKFKLLCSFFVVKSDITTFRKFILENF